jgi:hypothetical protein
MSEGHLGNARGTDEQAAKDAEHAARVGGAHAQPDDRQGGEDPSEDRTSQTEDTGSQPTGS